MNKENQSTEILINATMISKDDYAQIYEFVLDSTLKVTECVHIVSLSNGIVAPINSYKEKLAKVLFELNHVRVNPKTDNTEIINTLTNALVEVGLKVNKAPTKNSIALCFKPLGEISDTVRFYFGADAQCIFMSPSKNFKLVSNQ